MSIFGKIWGKITGSDRAATGSTGAASGGSITGLPSAAPASTASGANFSDVAGSSSSAPAAPVDVEAIMMDLEAKSGHKSNWRHSIVDLMSLLGIDNSLAERKALAKELGYTGDMNDSATMNIWLHKQVMQQMAANGGKVPANMLD
jgi:hypothetical protein